MLTLRQGLYKSKNMVSIRILQAIGPQYGQDYLTRFGFDKARQPAVLPLALGAGSVTPLQVAGAYAVFANGGYRITPYLIDRVTDSNGKVIMQSKPVVAGDAAARAIDPRTAWIMDDILRGVATYGTAARARVLLKRNDIAGKTGTTNESVDAWFSGCPRWWRPRGWASTSPSRWARARPAAASPCRSGWTTCRPRSRACRGKAAPRPDGIIVENGEYYFSEFPPGQAVARLGLPQADTLGEFLNGLGGGGEDNSIKVAPGVGAQGNAPGRRRYRSDREKAGSDRAGFSWPGRRPTGVRVRSGGGFEKPARRTARCLAGTATGGSSPARRRRPNRSATAHPAAADRPACHSSAGRRSDNGTRRCAATHSSCMAAWLFTTTWVLSSNTIVSTLPLRLVSTSTSSEAAQSSAWLSMLFSTWSINARNSVSVIIEPARITEFPVSQLAYSRMALRIVATLVATGLVAACGYKGPLYMPTPDGKPPSTAKQQKQQQPIIPPAPRCPDAPGRHAPGQPGAADNKSPRMGLLLAQSRPIRAGRRNAGPTGTCSRPGRRSR